MIIQCVNQFLTCYRFNQYCIKAPGFKLVERIACGISGIGKYLQFAQMIVFSDGVQDLEATHLWHGDVQQDARQVQASELLQGIDAAFSLVNGPTKGPQDEARQNSVDAVVINNQDGFRGGHATTCSRRPIACDEPHREIRPIDQSKIKLVMDGMVDRFHGDEGLKEPMNPLHVDGL